MCTKLLKVRDVAELLSIARPTVYKLVNNGEIPFIRLGKTLRFSRKAIERWLDANSTTGIEAAK